MGANIGSIQQLSSVFPWFLRGTNFGAMLESILIYYDLALETLYEGLSFTQPNLADSSALTSLIRDRAMGNYPSMPEAATRQMLTQWLQYHRGRGSERGKLLHIAPYFQQYAPVIQIVTQLGGGYSALWHQVNAAGVYSYSIATPSNWNWDGMKSEYWRYWVLIYAPAGSDLNTCPTYDGGAVYDDPTVNYDGIVQQVGSDVYQICNEWRSARSVLWGIGLVHSNTPATFGPTQTGTTLSDGTTTMPLGGWGKVTASSVKRLQTIDWIVDLGQG